jgi:hypothetical protein
VAGNEGLPIEDVGIAGTPYAMSEDDVLYDNRDLIAHCLATLRELPFSRMKVVLDEKKRTIRLATNGLDCIGISFDGRAEPSRSIKEGAEVTIEYSAQTRVAELTGLADSVVRQRRRLRLR